MKTPLMIQIGTPLFSLHWKPNCLALMRNSNYFQLFLLLGDWKLHWCYTPGLDQHVGRGPQAVLEEIICGLWSPEKFQ